MSSDSFESKQNIFEENSDLPAEDLETTKNQDTFAEKALARLDEILFSHEKLEAHYSGGSQKERTFEPYDYSELKVQNTEELREEDASKIADGLRSEGINIEFDPAEETNDWGVNSL